MVKRACECEADRLRRHVEGRLQEAEQDRLAAHLEGCEQCRGALDALAGDDRLWNDLRVYLVGEPDLSTPPPGPIGDEGGGRSPRDDWDVRRAVLAFLEPPVDTRSLGSLGPYQVLEVIGRGGMGLVLKASDPALGRVVAIKVLAPELSYLGSARMRFAREARAAASVAHEHVVAIHAVDSWKGLPYLVMQYVAGKSLQGRIEDDGPLAVREVLRIGMQVASGLAAAHAQGLVHRDIKPANILLENGIERVRITDFGLARAADDASLSQSGVAAGTPHYMAPEQARCEPIDARVDLFGLGGVMYAMCSGHPPFRAETTMAVLRRVCEDTPRPIRTAHPEIPDWLDRIIAKLLAKDPVARFQSAAEVAELLGRCLVYLEHPTAVPPFPEDAECASSRRRGSRWRAAAIVGLVLVAGLAAAEAFGLARTPTYLATALRGKPAEATLVLTLEDPDVTVRVDGEERSVAGEGPSEFRVHPGRHRIVATRHGIPVLDEEMILSHGGRRMVAIHREAVAAGKTTGGLPRPSEGIDPSRAIGESRELPAIGSVLEELRPVPVTNHDPVSPWPFGVVNTAAYSPDGTELALGCGDGSVTLSSTRSQRLRAILGPHPGRVVSLAYSPDGKTLATAGGDWKSGTQTGFVTLWDVATGRRRASPAQACELELAVAFSPGGETLAWGGRGRTVTLWDVSTGRVRASCVGHEGTVRALAFHPRSPRLVSAGFDGTIRFWAVTSGEEEGAPIRLAGKSSNCVAVSPDGQSLVANTAPRSDDPGWGSPSPGSLLLWDWGTRQERFTLKGHRYHILGVAFSPDGKTLASAGGHFSEGAEVKLWDVASGRQRRSLAGHRWWVESVAFSPDSRSLVSAGGFEMDAGEVRVWDLSSPKKPTKK